MATELGMNSSVGSEVAVWDPVLGVPPSVFHPVPVLVLVLVLFVPIVIGWLYSDGFLDCAVAEEWWRIVTWDTSPATGGWERERVLETQAFGFVVGAMSLVVLVSLACHPPQTPERALQWRHQVDLVGGVLIALWLLSHCISWAGAADLAEGRRARRRRPEANLQWWERERRALAADAAADAAVERTAAALRRVARGSRRLRRDKLREESMASDGAGAGCGGAGRVGGGAGRGCGRGGGRVGGRTGLRSATAAAVADPIKAAWDLDTECFRRLTTVAEGSLELPELRGLEHRVEKMMLRLDAVEIARDNEDRRAERKGVLMALEATAQYIEALLKQTETTTEAHEIPL